MKSKHAPLLAAIAALTAASAEAQYTTNTLSFSGASWNDGGSLDGYFTIQYDVSDTPCQVLSLDVTTGDGTSDGFLGNHYIYNVDGQANTVDLALLDAEENFGAPANELEAMDFTHGYTLFLDWQGSTPTSLYVGDVGGQYSSENYGENSPRSLNSEGGSAGVVPEPSIFVLAGFGALGLLFVVRRRSVGA